MATVKELREQAKAAGIKGYSRMRKAELEFNEPVTREVSEVRSLRESKITEKETVRMARKTTEQAISEVRAATTESEVKAILECLTKAQIFEVGLEILKCESTPYAQKTDKKAKIIEYFAFAIMSEQMIERIMSQTLEEKAKSLLEVHFSVMRYVVESLGVYEQIALLSKYGISYEEFKREGEGYRLKTNLQYTLIEKIYKHKDELMEHLSKQSRTETNDTANAEKETVIMVKTNEVTTAKTKTLSELQDRVEVLKGIYELYCLQVKTSKYHLQDVMSKENRTCYEVMQARDEYKSARYERFRTYVEYWKMLSELRAATEIRKETITMTEKAKLTVKELDEAIKSASNRDESEALLKEATVKTLRELMRWLNGFDGEWYKARKAELIEALLDYYGSVWEKETETTEQIIAEIESAETLSEIRAVLNECTKGELHEVYESITGNLGESNSWKKDDLVSWYSKLILAHKESEKQNEEIEEFTEDYVSCEEEKLSEISQKANEIEKCVTVEEISEKLASWDKETALDVCALLLGEERIRYPEPYSLKEYAEQILADRSLRESVEADMSDQMPKSIDQEIREAAIKQNICLMECVNANQRYGMYKERAHQLRLELRMNRQYAYTFKKSGYGVPEELRMLISSQTEEYHEMRIERFRSYWRCQESKEKYDEAESALNALERVKEELSA